MSASVSDPRPATLVVDDDGLIRMDAVGILEDAGFEVLDAPSADHALVLLEENWAGLQLLFTDVHMPGTREGFALAVASPSAGHAPPSSSPRFRPHRVGTTCRRAHASSLSRSARMSCGTGYGTPYRDIGSQARSRFSLQHAVQHPFLQHTARRNASMRVP